MKKHSQLKWLASLALGAGVLAAYGIHDAQAAYAALPADGTAGVVEQKEAQPLRWFTEKADAVEAAHRMGIMKKLAIMYSPVMPGCTMKSTARERRSSFFMEAA